MAKNAVGDWDTTASNNSDIGGINIAEGCAAANVNNAIREMMAQIATWENLVGILSEDETVTGNWTMASPTLTAPTINTSLIFGGTTFTGVSGSDVTLITGTAGTDGYVPKWNADGDIVDGYEVLDEDDMTSDSATSLATQQSIKAYVDGLLIGVGQTWQDVSASRTEATSYQNTTGKAIMVSVEYYQSAQSLFVSDDNVTFVEIARMTSAATGPFGNQVTALIPAGHYYKIDDGTGTQIGTRISWVELR